MRDIDHGRKEGYLAAYKQIALNAKQKAPAPTVAWWKLAALTLRSWAYGR